MQPRMIRSHVKMVSKMKFDLMGSCDIGGLVVAGCSVQTALVLTMVHFYICAERGSYSSRHPFSAQERTEP
jgi:hypothetical protein